MEPDKPKWTAALKKIMHDDYVVVGALNSVEDLEHYTIGDYFHLANWKPLFIRSFSFW